MMDRLTVDKVLHLRMFGNNQTKLANFLNVSRNTLRKYKSDLKGHEHMISVIDGKYYLFANVSNQHKEDL